MLGAKRQICDPRGGISAELAARQLDIKPNRYAVLGRAGSTSACGGGKTAIPPRSYRVVQPDALREHGSVFFALAVSIGEDRRDAAREQRKLDQLLGDIDDAIVIG